MRLNHLSFQGLLSLNLAVVVVLPSGASPIKQPLTSDFLHESKAAPLPELIQATPEILPASSVTDTSKKAQFGQHSPVVSSQPDLDKVVIDEIPETIKVRRFSFSGATVFSRKQLEEVIKKALRIRDFTQLTFAQLLQARSAITQFYIDSGYITSGAYLPEQDFVTNKGEIEIRVIEGKLDKPTVRVNSEEPVEEEDRKNFESCLARQLTLTGPLNQKRLLDDLRLLLAYNFRLEKLEATLQPGDQVGRNKLDVSASRKSELPPSWEEIGKHPLRFIDIELKTDNDSSPSVGSIGQQLQINLGRQKLLFTSLAFTRTEGSTGFEFDLNFPPSPENEWCTRYSYEFKGGFRANRIIQRPFNELDIQSASRHLDGTFKRETQLTPGKAWALGATLSYQDSETSLLGIPFALFSGDNSDGSSQIIAFRPFIELTRRSSLTTFVLRSELTVGANFNTLTASNFIPKDIKGFALIRGQMQWVNSFAPDTLLILNSNVQIATNTLPALEQLGLGGQNTIRGYRKNFLLTDNGFLASAELQLPIIKIPSWQMVVKLTPFFDFGSGWNSSGKPNPAFNTLLSTGIGLLLEGDQFYARVDWGFPLVNVNGEGSSLQEKGIYFQVVGTLKF